MLKVLYELAVKYIHAYKNSNYDFVTNGELALLKKVAKEGNSQIFFDIGANKGDWVNVVLELFKEPKIHCFEAIPQIFTKLKQNIPTNNTCFLNNFGLWNEDTTITFTYFKDEDQKSSAYFESVQMISEKVEVPVRKGEDYCKENNIECIDFMKIDVEGAEGKIIEGFEKMIQQNKIKIIQFEYGRFNIDAGYLLKHFFNLFEKNGYKVGKLYPTTIDFSGYNYEKEDFLGPNYVAILEKYYKNFESL